MFNSRVHSIVLILFELSFEDVLTNRHQWVHHQPTKRQIKQSNTTVSCEVPTKSADGLFTIYDLDHQPITDRQAGSLVPKFTQIERQCSDGYLFEDGSDASASYCNYIGAWHPRLKPCHRVCPKLRTSNVMLTCKDKRGGIIDCNGLLLTGGTQVTANCMPLHQLDPLTRSESDFIRCRDDGRWDKELIKCVPECGIPLHQPLIANGSDTQFGEFPWHVAIYKVPLGNKYICGGTLITTNMVLSAAHCFYNETKGVPSKNPGDYEIIVGKMTSDYNRVDNFEQQKFEVSEIHFAPNEYNPTVSYAADIAIIILKGNITISQYVLPACFIRPERSGFKPGKNMEGALPGWGLDENNEVSKTLKMARLPFMDYNACSKTVAHVTVDKFCAGADTGPKPLRGDSGGGLVFKEGLFYYVRGIVSTRGKWSDSSLTTFTDISFYQEWIESTIQRGISGKTGDDERRTSTDDTPHPSFGTSAPGAISKTTTTTPMPTRTPLIPTQSPSHGTTTGQSSRTDERCKARNTPKMEWSCKRVADCKVASKLLSTFQDYWCGSGKERICCPDQNSVSTSTVGPSTPLPNYIEIIEQKCLEYAEARYQNVCTTGQQRGMNKTCRRVMDCDRVETLIVGGTEVKPKEFPHMALLGRGTTDGFDWYCGGTLISERFILTAAQCATSSYDSDPTAKYWAGLGFVNKAELTLAELNKKLFAIDKRYVHPNFEVRKIIRHAIGLVRLKNPVKFSPYIRPICLRTETYGLTKKSLNESTVAGWGQINTGSKEYYTLYYAETRSETLLKAALRILPNELCTDTYKVNSTESSGYSFDSKYMLCAGFPESNKDTCKGDSGGPLQIKNAMECMYTQLGITSFTPRYCGEGEPTGYTRVSSYLDWIQPIVWP